MVEESVQRGSRVDVLVVDELEEASLSLCSWSSLLVASWQTPGGFFIFYGPDYHDGYSILFSQTDLTLWVNALVPSDDFHTKWETRRASGDTGEMNLFWVLIISVYFNW